MWIIIVTNIAITMKSLTDRILRDGRCLDGGILDVDRFINAQMDPNLMKQVAVELFSRFASFGVTKGWIPT